MSAFLTAGALAKAVRRTTSVRLHEFRRQNRVRALGHRCARHDSNRFARMDHSIERAARHGVADHRHRQAAVRTRPFRARRDDGEAVHRGALEAGHLHVAGDRSREHAARGHAQRHGFGAQGLELRVEPLQRLRDCVALRKPAHAHVIRHGGIGPGTHRSVCYVPTGIEAVSPNQCQEPAV